MPGASKYVVPARCECLPCGWSTQAAWREGYELATGGADSRELCSAAGFGCREGRELGAGGPPGGRDRRRSCVGQAAAGPGQLALSLDLASLSARVKLASGRGLSRESTNSQTPPWTQASTSAGQPQERAQGTPRLLLTRLAWSAPEFLLHGPRSNLGGSGVGGVARGITGQKASQSQGSAMQTEERELPAPPPAGEDGPGAAAPEEPSGPKPEGVEQARAEGAMPPPPRLPPPGAFRTAPAMANILDSPILLPMATVRAPGTGVIAPGGPPPAPLTRAPRRAHMPAARGALPLHLAHVLPPAPLPPRGRPHGAPPGVGGPLRQGLLLPLVLPPQLHSAVAQ